MKLEQQYDHNHHSSHKKKIKKTERIHAKYSAKAWGEMDVVKKKGTETWSSEWKIEIRSPLVPPPPSPLEREVGGRGDPASCKTLRTVNSLWKHFDSFKNPNFISL